MTERDFTLFCIDLIDSDELYHFDDDPFDLVDCQTGAPILWQPERIALIMHTVDEAFKALKDPFINSLIALRFRRIYPKAEL